MRCQRQSPVSLRTSLSNYSYWNQSRDLALATSTKLFLTASSKELTSQPSKIWNPQRSSNSTRCSLSWLSTSLRTFQAPFLSKRHASQTPTSCQQKCQQCARPTVSTLPQKSKTAAMIRLQTSVANLVRRVRTDSRTTVIPSLWTGETKSASSKRWAHLQATTTCLPNSVSKSVSLLLKTRVTTVKGKSAMIRSNYQMMTMTILHTLQSSTRQLLFGATNKR